MSRNLAGTVEEGFLSRVSGSLVGTVEEGFLSRFPFSRLGLLLFSGGVKVAVERRGRENFSSLTINSLKLFNLISK